ncbi:MAG TPA: helix-turn-helix transcriptional regulator [Solirubrobacterales bacterium]|nr:helix-turn-helix transcriptional regulator [Solirubrobacterales bacterium]
MAKPRTPHDVALDDLIPGEERADYDRRVKALIARNTLLATLESAREAEKISKKDLADRAGLDASSVRRMLTAETANPTAESAFLLLSAMDIKLEAILPSGSRIEIV